MKKLLAKLLLSTLLLVFSTWSAWALFYDFENEAQADDWQIFDGAGSIEDGRYVLQNTVNNSGIAVLGDMTWTDCVIKCKAMFLEGSEDNIGFVWRLAQNNHFYVISLRMDQRIGYCGCINGAWMNGGSPINLVPFDTEVEKEYELEFVIEGTNARLFVDGEDMGDWDDDQLDTGMIGIRVWLATMSIDDFEINGPGIPATAVESQGKLAITWGNIK